MSVKKMSEIVDSYEQRMKDRQAKKISEKAGAEGEAPAIEAAEEAALPKKKKPSPFAKPGKAQH